MSGAHHGRGSSESGVWVAVVGRKKGEKLTAIW